jgi:hypothetical protein
MRKLLWFTVLISLVFMLPQIRLRVLNETNNDSVLLAADYSEFTSNLPTEGPFPLAVFGGLKQASINAFLLKAPGSDGGKEDTAFNMELLDKLRSSGFEVVIQLDSFVHSVLFYDKLDDIVEKFSIKYVLLYEEKKDIKDKVYAPSHTDISRMREIINKHNLLTFITENPQQTGYVKVPGSDELISSSGYSISRAFFIPEKALYSSGLNDVPYIWMRAIAERNARLVWIKPLDVKGGNIDNTLDAVSKLSNMLLKKGFILDSPSKPTNNSTPSSVQGIPVTINLAAALWLYILYFFPQNKMPHMLLRSKWMFAIASLVIALGLLQIAFWTSWGSLSAAFWASVIYPSLSGLLILRLVDGQSGSFIFLTARSIFTLLVISGMGALTVSASMYDIRYTMHLINFNMVIPAYILPLLSFNANWLVLSRNQRRPSLKADILYLLVLLIVMGIYLARSGNFDIIPAIPVELEVRNFLESTMSARPRWKEFIVGYPCTLAFIYLYRKKAPFRLLCLLGTFSTVTAVSILNSFCHGFTPIITSANRSVNGLLLGLLTGSMSALLAKNLYNEAVDDPPPL